MKKFAGVFVGLLLISGLIFFAGCVQNNQPPKEEESPYVFMQVPLVRQGSSYTSGVATLQSILAYNGFPYSQEVLATEVGATYANGTNPMKIVESLQKRDIGADFREDMSLDELKDYLASNQPVICMIQAWSNKQGFDYANGWSSGHYAIAVGYDDERVYFMDPGTLGNYAYLDYEEFELRWHDERGGVQYRNAGIIVTNVNTSYDSQEFKYLG